MAKFCLDFTGDLNVVHPYLTLFANFLFPSRAVAPDSRACLEVVGWYYVHYLEAMLVALDAHLIDAITPVERSGPCHVARLAGFLNESSAVDAGSSSLAKATCGTQEHPAGTRSAASATSLMQRVYEFVFGQQEVKLVKNRRNKGRVALDFGDLWNSEQGRVCCTPLQSRFIYL